jgi:hypothetical protein
MNALTGGFVINHLKNKTQAILNSNQKKDGYLLWYPSMQSSSGYCFNPEQIKGIVTNNQINEHISYNSIFLTNFKYL